MSSTQRYLGLFRIEGGAHTGVVIGNGADYCLRKGNELGAR